jgi:hypothetical protein
MQALLVKAHPHKGEIVGVFPTGMAGTISARGSLVLVRRSATASDCQSVYRVPSRLEHCCRVITKVNPHVFFVNLHQLRIIVHTCN